MNDRHSETEPRRALTVMFVVDGAEHEVAVDPNGIFHDALHLHLPSSLTFGRRVRLATPDGHEIYPDMFIGEAATHFGTHRFIVTTQPLSAALRPFRNVGFDHLAIMVADRQAAHDFFSQVLGLHVVRHDAHLTVLTSGLTALFLFNADPETPMSDGLPSRWHHLGFVVDDLEAAYAHLRAHAATITSDFIMLERDERWSLYFRYRNGDISFLIQLSEIKVAERGFADPAAATGLMYDYARRRYGVRFVEEAARD